MTTWSLSSTNSFQRNWKHCEGNKNCKHMGGGRETLLFSQHTHTHTHLAEMELQATHEPLDGLHLLHGGENDVIKTRGNLQGKPFCEPTGVDETHLVLLVQGALQKKGTFSITKSQINMRCFISLRWLDWFSPGDHSSCSLGSADPDSPAPAGGPAGTT